MTGNQKKIVRTLQWIFYPLVALLLIDFILRFTSRSPVDTNREIDQLLELIDKVIMIIVFVVMGFVALALIQQFFTKQPQTTRDTQDAANAKLLLKIEKPHQTAGNAILLIIALAFSALLNMLLFLPLTLMEQEELDRFGLSEKIAFGFFYVLAHFLVIVFGQRLVKGKPPVFVATEKGFSYEPAGISTGWILWQDIQEVRESSVLFGSGVNNGPVLMPVLGIKLINPEDYNTAVYAPLLQRIVNWGQQFNNYQTEGVGDILLRPQDFGNEYEKVRNLIKEKSHTSFDYYSLTQ